MAMVSMEKNGETIQVNSAAVEEHRQLGWMIVTVSNDLSNVAIAIGDEATNTINVAVQFQNENAAALAESISVLAFLCDDTDGIDQTTTAPDGHVAAGTNGGCIHLITDKFFLLNTDANGSVDFDIIESTAKTWYLVLVFPNGERVISTAITFTA